jgi:hypothetical protein
VGPTAGLDDQKRREKKSKENCLPCQEWNPGLSSPYPVALQTELSRLALCFGMRVMKFLLNILPPSSGHIT